MKYGSFKMRAKHTKETAFHPEQLQTVKKRFKVGMVINVTKKTDVGYLPCIEAGVITFVGEKFLTIQHDLQVLTIDFSAILNGEFIVDTGHASLLFVCNGKKLLDGLHIMRSGLTAGYLPLQLVAQDGMVHVSSEYSNISITFSIEGHVVFPGSISVDAKLFFAVIVRVAPKDITISVQDNGALRITALNEFSIDSVDEKANQTSFLKTQFEPLTLSDIQFDYSIVMDGFQLKQAIRAAACCCFPDSVEPTFFGIHFTLLPNMLQVSCLDGVRAGLCECPINFIPEPRQQWVLPCEPLARALKGISGERVCLAVSKTHVRLTFDNASITARRLNIPVFNHNAIFVTKGYHDFVLDKMPFKEVLQSVAVFTPPRSNDATLFAIEPEGHVRIEHQSALGRQYQYRGSITLQPSRETQGLEQELHIALNTRQFKGLLDNLEQPIRLSVKESDSPVLLRGNTVSYAIMPKVFK